MVTNAGAIQEKNLLFATAQGMVKVVPSSEFETNNRAVASTKLQDEDKIIAIRILQEETDVVLQTTNGIFLRFPLEEISLMKKNAKGVRGIKLSEKEKLERVYLLSEDSIATYKEKEVHLNRLKQGKRDGKGTKARG